MNLNQKLVAAARHDGVVHNLTADDITQLQGRGLVRWIATTGRWLLTEGGRLAAEEIEAELSAAELAEVSR